MAKQDRKRYTELAYKYQEGTITSEEKQEFEQWLNEANDVPLDIFTNARNDAEYETMLFKKIQQEIGTGREVTLWARIAAAASILIVIGAGTYLFTKKSPPPLVANDVRPFTGQAILHTGRGKSIVLDHAQKGSLMAGVQKSADNAIAYNDQASNAPVIYDTLEISSGGRPQKVNLADGSVVTLNVSSKLRFPEGFRQNASQLELIDGEAYFDIKHDLSKPVKVKAKDQAISDIGTQFDVKTYRDEPDSRTTLVEGAIKVNGKALQPGKQAIISGNNVTIAKANLIEVTAWVDGYFRFKGENIQIVMRELARWYNIEVTYQGNITQTGFFIRVARSKNVSEVLQALEHTHKVHFKIEGRRVTVIGKK